jgi:hypothetical protein
MERADLLIDLMRRYGKLGIESWKSVKQLDKDNISKRLDWKIAESIYDVTSTIDAYFDETKILKLKAKTRFIPMPCTANDFVHAFFLPLREKDSKTVDRFSFDLFLIVDGDNSIGLRWEPSDSPSNSHGYGHVQLCRSMVRGTTKSSGIPNWMPKSYPAIPISTSDPLHMFLSMATSVHGYEQRMSKLIQDIYPEGVIRKECLNELSGFLLAKIV